MQVALHSHMFHYFIIFLVVLDALIVLTELLLDLGAFGIFYSTSTVIVLITTVPLYMISAIAFTSMEARKDHIHCLYLRKCH